MSKVIELTSLLLQVKRNVTVARSPYERFRWRLLQATIEGMMAQGEQKLVIGGTVESKKKRTTVRV